MSKTVQQIYEREGGEGVGVKEQLLNEVAQGYHHDKRYEDKPEYWQTSGISKEEFDAAQAKAVYKHRANAIHSNLTGGKP